MASLRNPAVLALLLAAVTFAVYWPVLGHDFLAYDDPEFVTANPRVLEGLTWSGVGWAFRTAEFANRAPLTWLSHMLDVQLYGASPRGHHVSNLILHAGNTVLLFLLLSGVTGATWRSAAAAALFALHPLHVESVAWIAERRDLLSVFFGLLALWAYTRHATSERPAPAPRGWYVLTVIFFVCGLMSKQLLVTLPGLMLLFDVWPLERWPRLGAWRLIREKIPLFALSLVAGGVALSAQGRAGYLPSLTEIPLSSRLANAVESYAAYLFDTFWPFDLAVYYPYPESFSARSVAGAAVLLGAITVLVVRYARGRPWLAVGWAWYGLTLFPVIGLIQTSTHARSDGYTYLPLIGVFLIVAWAAGELVGRYRIAAGILTLALLLACAVRTRDQLRHWQDTESLFRHALAVTQNNFIAHDVFGDALADRGRNAEAIEQYRQALRIKPDYTTALNNLGNALLREGRTDEAEAQYREALRIRPDYAAAHYNLGNLLAATGNAQQALEHFEHAIRIRPTAAVLSNLAIVLDQMGRVDEAIATYRRAIELAPDAADAHYNLAVTLERQGRTQAAVAHYREVLRIRPADAAAHRDLGVVLANSGRFDEAVVHFRETLRLDPGQPRVREYLRQLGRP